MKTLIRLAKTSQKTRVPITAFEFESFELRVRRVMRRKPLPIGVSCRKLNVGAIATPMKTISEAIDADQAANVFPPSPSVQGHGLMCSHFEARPVAEPVAPPARFPGSEPQNPSGPSVRGSLISIPLSEASDNGEE